jgi:serine protease
MNKSFAFLLTVSLVLASAVCAFSAETPQRMWVQFRPGSANTVAQAAALSGGTVHYRFDDLNSIAVTLLSPALEAIRRNPNVVFVEPDPARYLISDTVPYGINLVAAPEVHPLGVTGSGVKVGIIDTGIAITHVEFSGMTISGGGMANWNNDRHGHGTHVAGTIAAQINGVGVIGVSPGVSFHIVRVFDDSGRWAYSSDLINAARLCRDAGVRIISMSLGGGTKSSTEEAAFRALYENNGILLVAAAGNSGTTSFSFPASYASVISVAAVDSNKQHASFSQRNSQVELAAPGVGVLSTIPENRYGTMSGTSMATPHVSGVAALVWGAAPQLTAQELRTVLQATAEDIDVAGRDAKTGFGLVDAHAAWAAVTGGSGSGSGSDTGGGSGGGSVDTEAPIISGVAARVTNAKNGSFEISFSTNEAAVGQVTFTSGASGTFTGSGLATSHKFSFRGSKGVSYTYTVRATDEAGNRRESGPHTHKN